ncbi:putative RNA helicase [Apophysomyces ossiformis]|uniref:Putative RNA helicase n=1 Tax=Apophysomyces ossiformis TaxID=679940 RepID=A0A8H7BZF5_9FUNG|nr:putative RNA helicase [Apophysomyces ossiformis]
MSGRVAAALKKEKPHKAPSRKSFSDIGVDEWLVETLKSMQIRQPTEIQQACIPPILAGRDVIGGAKTGSGKTAAFALPILQKLSEDPYGVFALVLTPTRELAFQIAEQFRVLGKSMGLKESVVVGGLDMMKQALELAKRPHVIIATPGRLRDHIQSSSGAVCLSRAKFLVMDEADRILSETFMSDLEVILPLLPEKRQTLLFTATMTDSILALRDAKEDPNQRPFVHLCDMSVSTVTTLEQLYVFAPSHVRTVYLAHILQSDDFKDKSIIIFCGRCSTAEMITVMLKELGIRCTALHSEMSQQQRLDSLGKFRAEVIKILISTDVGSRGLDIPSVELVLNYDIPRDPTDYIHRVGRTARAGRGGKALSIVSEKDVELVQNIEARINKQMEEYKISDNAIMDKLSEVSTAKRVASMHMHDTNFGEKRHSRKKKKMVAKQ